MRHAGLPVKAVVIHHDVDRSSLANRRALVDTWFKDNLFHEHGLHLVICAPDPCLERWLCICEGSQTRVKAAKPSAGGEPWKHLWNKGKGITLDRVREAAQYARAALHGHQDFDSFFEGWKAAGLEEG